MKAKSFYSYSCARGTTVNSSGLWWSHIFRINLVVWRSVRPSAGSECMEAWPSIPKRTWGHFLFTSRPRKECILSLQILSPMFAKNEKNQGLNVAYSYVQAFVVVYISPSSMSSLLTESNFVIRLVRSCRLGDPLLNRIQEWRIHVIGSPIIRPLIFQFKSAPLRRH